MFLEKPAAFGLSALALFIELEYEVNLKTLLCNWSHAGFLSASSLRGSQVGKVEVSVTGGQRDPESCWWLLMARE